MVALAQKKAPGRATGEVEQIRGTNNDICDAGESKRKDYSSVKITYLESKAAKESTEITLADAIDKIKTGDKWKDKVELWVRAANVSKEHRDAMKHSLPAFVFAGTFRPGNPSQKTLIEHSGLLSLDIDGHDGEPDAEKLREEWEDIRDSLQRDEHTVALFKSPTGTGMKAIVAVDAKTQEEHRACYWQAAWYYENVYDLHVATVNESDVARKCYASYDPQAFFRPVGAVPFKPLDMALLPDLWPEKAREIKTKGGEKGDPTNDPETVRAASNYINKIPGVDKRIDPKKSRNCATFPAACVLVNDFGLEEETARKLLASWNVTHNYPSLEDGEVNNCLKSAMSNASGDYGSKRREVTANASGIKEGAKIMATTDEAKEAEVDVSEIDFRDTDETVGEEENQQDVYGVGGEDMETALRGVEEALNTEFSGRRSILATMVDLMRWRTMYDDEAAPREYCLSTALYAMCACWTNNRFVVHDWDTGSELRNKQAATDPAALDEANPWGKLMITLKTRGGRDRLALQGNFLNIGVSGNGKDQPAKILYDIFPHFGKKLLSTDRLSAEGLIKNAAKNNNNDLHLRITEASEIFDERAYKHGILTSILTTGYQVGQDCKVNADDRKSAFCGFYWPSMLLSVQPDKIRRRLRKEDLNQGAFRRILYTYAQPAKLTAKEIDEINSNIKCGEHYDEMLAKVIKAMKRIGSYVWEVNLGDYPAQIKKRIYADFGKRNPDYLDVETAIYSYTKSVCDMYLPIIAFCLCPQPDLSGDNQMMQKAWNAAEKIMRYYILVAEEVFAMAGNYNEEAEKENEHAKIVLSEIKRLSKEEKYTVKLCVDPENKKYKRFLSYKILRQFSRKIKAILSAEELKKIIMTLEADGKVIWRRPTTGGGMGMIAAI